MTDKPTRSEDEFFAREEAEKLHRMHSADIVLPTAETNPRQLRIRCVVRPDPDQAALFDRLGLRLPERLRITSAAGQM